MVSFQNLDLLWLRKFAFHLKESYKVNFERGSRVKLEVDQPSGSMLICNQQIGHLKKLVSLKLVILKLVFLKLVFLSTSRYLRTHVVISKY